MKKIYINLGHSNSDPGAVGYEVERQLIVQVGQYMNDYLVANYDCETRTNSGSVGSLTTICNDANRWGAHLFVSIHFNAGGGDGFEALVYNLARVPLGEIFAKHVAEIGQNLREYGAAPGVKIRSDLAVLRRTNMPAVLCEGAFIDNLKDIQDWNDPDELKSLGIAYAKAAAESLDLEVIRQEDVYTQEDFIEDIQDACGATVDGIAGPETLRKTPTISATKNRRHPAVYPVQRWLLALGYTQVGEPDGVAGPMFEEAMKAFQHDHYCVEDGEATAKKKTWKCLLGMI